MKPHPAVLILLWVLLAVVIQSLAGVTLFLIGVPLLIIASTLSVARLLVLLRRTRWIMLSLLLIYAYTTPGSALLAPLAQYSPTEQGLAAGLIQLSRLVFALAGLSVLLSLLPQRQLISGLYVLAYPLRFAGWSRERIAVRLALTLNYAESMPVTLANWRSIIEVVPTMIEESSVELHVIPFALRDGLLLTLGCASLAAMMWYAPQVL